MSSMTPADARVSKSASKFAFDDVDAAVAAMCAKVTAVATERVCIAFASGRVLAEAVVLDRPSPACNVSAMDGYALRMADAKPGSVAVAGEVQAGVSSGDLPQSKAMRVFTGAMLPAGTELVIQREHVTEKSDAITLPAELKIKQGQHMRVMGENGRPGDVLCHKGNPITAPMLAAMSSVGMMDVLVYRKVRVGILVTGGEVLDASATPQPWQIRDGNGPALLGLLGQLAWLEAGAPVHVHDEPGAIRRAIAERLAACDVLLMTGGVSAGDYDFVPSVLKEMEAEIVFHKLPIRPGKPVLGAVSAAGVPILGLPGNPVSVMVTARRIAMGAIRQRGGILNAGEKMAWVEAVDTLCAPANLTWYALVKLSADGQAHAVGGKGSGDWVSAAESDGFVEVPAGAVMAGRRRYFAWPGREA